MAELVPAVAAELQKEIAAYEWHRGARKAPRVLEISTTQRELAERLSIVLNLDIARVLDDALTRGLKALESSPVPASKLKERTQEARANVAARYLPGAKHKRKAK